MHFKLTHFKLMHFKFMLFKFMLFMFITLLVAQPAPAAKSKAAETVQASGPVTVLTWNILFGSDKPPHENGWKERRLALTPALKAAHPDVFCTQEARLEQLQYIDKEFPTWARVGGGRDDGKNAGEFCAIYYNKKRLEVLKSGTFWLSITPDSPQNTWDGNTKRICTHALFRDRINETKFVVLSTHFPLKPQASEKAAKVVADKITALYENMPTLLCGDFNCEPGSEAWKVFSKIYLDPVDEKHQVTRHDNGRPMNCIDSIFKNEDIRVVELKILKDKFNNTYPSDHYGLLIKAFIPEINQ
ncbi:MAG: endonuclease/exonuclease/phosphatase family protein [Candidatus Melainabacteria bacterium]|nr:endonuclease/exonuclease/phosphatase family protein [Candidatus Melainabacteria bacterium]